MALLTERLSRSEVAVSRRVLGEILAIGLILAVGVVTRLSYLDLVEFRGDEARVAGLAAGMLDGQGVPLVSIVSSAGINNPPLFVYLMAIPLAISRDPAVATGFVGLLGVGAVALTYRFCAEHFDRRTGQVAALLFAASPWAVVLSRRIQSQDAVPFFTLLWIGSLFQVGRGRAAHLVGVAVWLSALLQLHQASAALIPVTVLALALRARQLRLRDVVRWGVVALVVTAIIWTPFLIFQLTHDLADVRAVERLLRQPPRVDLAPIQWVVDLASANGYDAELGSGFAAIRATTLSFDPIYLAERVVFLAAIAYLIGRLVRGRGRAASSWRDVVLLLWLVVPPLFFLRHSSPIYPHYLVVVCPAQFIAIGGLISELDARVRSTRFQLVAALTALVITAITAAQVYGYFALMSFVATQPTTGGHGVPLRDQEAAMDRAVALAAGVTKPIYLGASEAEQPGAFLYLAGGRASVDVFDDNDTFVAPAADGTPTVYLIAGPGAPAASLLQRLFPDGQAAVVPFPGEASGYAVYRLPPDANARIAAQARLRPLDRTAPNGARLLGYDLPPAATPGSPLQLAVYWQVSDSPPPGEDYAFFAHLVDASGRVWAQADRLGYEPRYWRPGDLVVSWFTLDPRPGLAAGPGWVELGMYIRNGTIRLPFRDASGHAADHLLLGPLKLVPSGAPAAPPPGHLQPARFGGAIDLIGYDLAGEARPGGTLDVALVWSAVQNPGADETAFVHLLDASGQLIAQSDGQPGPYPTSLWQPGDRVRDAHAIPLPPNLPPGSYQLEVGLYRSDIGARLPTSGGDRVILGSSVVVGGS